MLLLDELLLMNCASFVKYRWHCARNTLPQGKGQQNGADGSQPRALKRRMDVLRSNDFRRSARAARHSRA
jgi:hypothetical protein